MKAGGLDVPTVGSIESGVPPLGLPDIGFGDVGGSLPAASAPC